MLKNAEVDKGPWSQGLETLPAKGKDPHSGNASHRQVPFYFLTDTDTSQFLQKAALSTKPHNLDFSTSPQHPTKGRKQNGYSMNNSWRWTKAKRHFPRSPSAQSLEVRSWAKVCAFTLSLLGNKRCSPGLQRGHKDVRNPGTAAQPGSYY